MLGLLSTVAVAEGILSRDFSILSMVLVLLICRVTAVTSAGLSAETGDLSILVEDDLSVMMWADSVATAERMGGGLVAGAGGGAAATGGVTARGNVGTGGGAVVGGGGAGGFFISSSIDMIVRPVNIAILTIKLLIVKV